MAKTQITADPGSPFIDVTREFDAPRDVLFRAHADPELIVQWLGPRRLTMVVDRYDVRDGGSWRYIHRDADGAEYGFHGVFHGTPSPDSMVQTFEFEGALGHVSLDAITLEEHDGRTLLRGHSVFQSVEARDAMIEAGMEGGLTEGYERLDELIARLVPVG
jgi:uncharacterized protein YndB with AHSA1/START domain